MVAYSFKRRFVDSIRRGLDLPVDNALALPKRQTIRADRKRHARPGEQLQHYCGMRRKGCFLIGRAVCTSVDEIRIYVNSGLIMIFGQKAICGAADLDSFAINDGFADWADMRAFWREEHDEVSDLFIGVIIKWKPNSPE